MPDSDERDVESAVAAALKAIPNVVGMPAAERCRHMLALADRIDANFDRLAESETIDTGKPLRLSKAVDIPRASANFGFFATAILHAHSESYRTDQSAFNYTLRQPRGVAGCISPWNLPLYLFTWKIAPALATGNTVVAKPSEMTPMTASMSRRTVPRGRPAAGRAQHRARLRREGRRRHRRAPGVPTISFTGGTRPAPRSPRAAAPLFKKVVAGAGRQEPDTSSSPTPTSTRRLPTHLRSAFENQGEICLCGSRIFVERADLSDVRRALRRQAAEALQAWATRSNRQPTRARWSRKPHFDKVTGYIAAGPRGGRRDPVRRRPAGEARRPLRGRLSSSQPTVIAGLPPGLPRQPGGDLRPGGDPDPVPDRGPKSIAVRQRDAVRPVGVAVDDATWRGRTASPTQLEAAPSGSTAGCCATCACRSAA